MKILDLASTNCILTISPELTEAIFQMVRCKLLIILVGAEGFEPRPYAPKEWLRRFAGFG